jgi:hypothetical protein
VLRQLCCLVSLFPFRNMCNEGFFYLLSRGMYFYYPDTVMNCNPRLKLLRIAVGLTTRKAESMMKCVRRSKEGKLAGKKCKRFSNFHVLGVTLNCYLLPAQMQFLCVLMVTVSMHLGCVWLSSVGVPYKISGLCNLQSLATASACSKCWFDMWNNKL